MPHAPSQPLRPLGLLLIATLAFVHASAFGHDPYEITLEVKLRKNGVLATMEMARSTAVAACDPDPSLGVLFEPDAFPEWKRRFESAGPELIALIEDEGALQLISCEASLTREDDVQILYRFASPQAERLTVQAPILNRFPRSGYGVQIEFRDKTGRWAHPELLLQDRLSAEFAVTP